MSKFLFIFLFSFSAFGAVRNSIQMKINNELSKPHHLALTGIRSLNSNQSYKELRSLAFNATQDMPIRWKAFMVMSELGGKRAVVDIKKALVGPEWYMRSAGLTALDSRDKTGAQKWAFKLLRSDPALLVRMKAFEVLKRSKKSKVTELFWAKLFSKDSFHNNRSLWIRNDIALHLSKEPRKTDLKHWVRLLHEGEQQFEVLASGVLSKISNAKGSVAPSISYWKKKYPQSKRL